MYYLHVQGVCSMPLVLLLAIVKTQDVLYLGI